QQQNVLRWSEALERIQRGASALKVAGVLAKVRERKSQRGRPFAFVEFSDPTGTFEVTFFSEILNSSRDMLEPGKLLVLTVEARMEEDSPRLVAQRVESLEDVVAKASAGLRITLEKEDPLDEIRALLSDCQQGNGYVHLMLDLPQASRRVELTLSDRYRILPEIQESLDELSGVVEVEFI
ncbi:MAG: DNA polymerase III subunit alpha, partial [Alphaproteobacteria bacterium]|nr:DNA polymerase III subunit alpha [Alphaproteobacteria bacterium]